MPTVPFATWMLEQEARALLTRLERVKPFALHETMLPAANILPTAQTAIERYLINGRRELKDLVHRYLGWLRGPSPSFSTHPNNRRFFWARTSVSRINTRSPV